MEQEGYMMQFCEVCNSIIHDGKCTNRRCASRDERLTSWLINGVLWRFRMPLTRTEAVEAVKDKADVIIQFKAPANSNVKVPVG
jgi:hypothetical protein